MANLILTERTGAVATLVINNPAKRNALTLAAWRGLRAAVAELDDDENLRCIVLRGAGTDAFAAGADISEFPDLRSNSAQAQDYGVVVAAALDALINCRHPTIAMIHGACTGGGLEIACCCDIRISGTSGRFGVPIKLVGHAFAYPEMVPVTEVAGRALVLELLLEGRIMEAAEAERRGLVSRMVDDAELEAEVREAAKRIDEGAPLAARATKRFINRLATGQPLTSEEVAESYALCDSEDYAEGVRAFTAKEKPKFRGR